MRFKGISYTHIGSREMNQDSFLVDNEKGVFAVADGVGGGLRGDDASRMAIQGVQKFVVGEHRLRNVFEAMQEAIYNEAMDTIGEPLMGTTLTVLAIEGLRAELCHAGDSRCYVISGGKMRGLTDIHETYDDQVKAPVLSSYLGIPTDVHPLRIQEEILTLKAGDRYLLCTDGLYKQLSEERILAIMTQYRSFPETMVEKLGEEAIQADFSDNVTLVYIEILSDQDDGLPRLLAEE